MQLAYRVYNLLCVMHPALCILILSLGFQPSVLTLVIHPTHGEDVKESACLLHSHSNLTTTPAPLDFTVKTQPWGLASFYFLACVASSGFAVVYLFAMDDTLTNSGGATAEDYARGSDLLFWCFLLDSICISLALPTQSLPLLDQLYLRCVLHFGALFLLCSGSQPQLSLSIALLVFLASAFVSTTVTCSQAALVLCYAHRFLDLLLVLAHRWEIQPPPETLYNSRLFYVAFSCLLLHLDVICL